MGRKSKKCQKKCAHHSFSLKPVRYTAIISRELQASFCPTALNNPSITPRFNKDYRYFTTSFMLPADNVQMYKPQQKIQKNQEYYKMEHEKYKQEIDHSKSNVLIAKPKSKNNYCNVCKTDFDDYLEHIKSGQHKITIKNNRFNGFILQLCQDVKQKLQKLQFKHDQNLLSSFSESNSQFFSQQSNFSDQKFPFKTQASFANMLQRSASKDCFYNSKSFHLLTENGSHNNIPLQNEQIQGQLMMQFSPIKKYSEISLTEGMKSICNIKPIIINSGINFDLIH